MEQRLARHGPVDLVFTAPPSKSFTHRALIAAALARGESLIRTGYREPTAGQTVHRGPSWT